MSVLSGWRVVSVIGRTWRTSGQQLIAKGERKLCVRSDDDILVARLFALCDTSPMKTLSQYLADAGITVRAFAVRAEISPSFISELTAKDEGRRKSPSLDVAKRIQAASGGVVAVGDWPGLKAIADAVNDSPQGVDSV